MQRAVKPLLHDDFGAPWAGGDLLALYQEELVSKADGVVLGHGEDALPAEVGL